MKVDVEVGGDRLKSIDVTPSPAAYRRMLEFIVETTTSAEDRGWAERELKRVENVVEWSHA